MALTPEQEADLMDILSVVGANRANLRGKSKEFFDETEARYHDHGANIFISVKQWSWLRDLYRQATT
jgi:hypothetical protein